MMCPILKTALSKDLSSHVKRAFPIVKFLWQKHEEMNEIKLRKGLMRNVRPKQYKD